MLTLRFDGLFRKLTENPEETTKAGLMCYGWLIQRDGIPIAQGHGGFARASEASSNIAEYLALIEGLDALQDFTRPDERICVAGDAKSVIDQMRGVSQVSAESVKPLYQRASRIARRFAQIEWLWQPRKNNHLADALTRKALRQIRRDRQGYAAALQAIARFKRRARKTAQLLPVMDLRLVLNPA